MLLIIYHVLEIRRNDGTVLDHCSSLALEVSTTRPLGDEMTMVTEILP